MKTFRSLKQNHLSIKLLIAVLLCSSCLTLLAVAYQIYFDYKKEIKAMDSNIQSFQKQFLPAIISSVYVLDLEQTKQLLKGSLNTPYIDYIEIKDDLNMIFAQGGDSATKKDVNNIFQLEYSTSAGNKIRIGSLTVSTSLEGVYQTLLERTWVILCSNIIKTFIAAFLILIVIHRIVVRHIINISNYTSSISLDESERELSLNRSSSSQARYDELDQLVKSINGMRSNLIRDLNVKTKSEASLKESEERFRRTVENLPFGAAYIEGERIILNKASEKITGYPPSEFGTLDQWFRSIYGEGHQVAREYYEEDYKAGFPSLRVAPLIRKNGQIRTVEFAASKHEVGNVWIFQDITERKQAEEALRASEEKFRKFYENSPFGIIINQLTKDANGKPVDCIHQHANPSTSSQLGISCSDLVGKKATDIVDEETAVKFIHKYGEVVRTGTSCNFEFYFSPRDRTLRVTAFHLTGDLFITTFTNVTERRRAQEERRKSEAKYEKMMKAIKDPVYICTQDYKIQYMNPSMIDRVGYNATGELCYEALHNLNDKCSWCKNYLFFKEGHVEKNIVSPQDSRTYNVSSSSFKNDDGSYSKISVFRDITDYTEMQKRLQQSQKMESIGNLAGGIAHDFNNILSSIIGFTELSLDVVEKGNELEGDLQEIYIAGLRAKDLVKQILTFARKSDEAIKPIQVNIIAKEVLRFLKSSIPSTIQINDTTISDSFIMGSSTQVHQILMNLCTNAAQAMEDKGGVLDVSVKDKAIGREDIVGLKLGEYIEIKVTDTGKGISQQYINNIFEPYFTTKPVNEGTGMGLAVVHGIVESYGGKIIVDSNIDEGTSFYIYLPITKKRKMYTHIEKEELPFGDEKILFVDDEAAVAKMGSRILEGLGYSVTTRTSSVEALQFFRAEPNEFDLIISDMTMPNMTGDELSVELMKIRPDIPVVLCTGYSKKMSEKAALEIGIKAFASKPITKADLAKTVRKVLDEAKSRT